MSTYASTILLFSMSQKLFLDARNPLGLFSICHVLQQQATEGVVLFCEAYSIVYTSISWKKIVMYFLPLTFQYYLHF